VRMIENHRARTFLFWALLLIVASFIFSPAKGSAQSDEQVRKLDKKVITIWIGTSVDKNMIAKAMEPFEKKTGIKVVRAGDATNSSAVPYLRDVLSGKADAAVVAISFEEWRDEAKKHGVTDADLHKITSRVVGRDVIDLIINKESGMKTLTPEQIKSAFSGTSKSWAEFGGEPVDIHPVAAKNKFGIINIFRKQAMQNAELAPNVIDVTSYADVLKKVETVPGAIGFGPKGTRSDKVTLITAHEVGRPATLITNGRPSREVQELINFLQNEGPALFHN
jgi:ABC-type phosphate transport system substrate-binding protein